MDDDRLDPALAAVERLRAAVLATRASGNWFSDQLDRVDLVQHSVARWVTDAGATFREFDSSLRHAVASPDREEVPDHDPIGTLEDAIVRAVAVRDRLRSLAALVFGSKCLNVSGRTVRFEPNESDLRRRLGDLAANGAAHAGRVKTLFEQAAEHPAVGMRNDVIHALSPFPELVETCWINIARLDSRGGIVSWSPGPLYPKGTLDQADAQPWTLYGWAVDTAEDAFGLLVELTDELAALVEEVGEIEPPPAVYLPPAGQALLDRP